MKRLFNSCGLFLNSRINKLGEVRFEMLVFLNYTLHFSISASHDFRTYIVSRFVELVFFIVQ